MGFFYRPILITCVISLIIFPDVALMQSSTTPTTTPRTSSSGNNGAIIAAGVGAGAALFIGSKLLSQATPKLISFGGRVLSVIPCSGGMLHVTILPAGIFPVTYIWTPATVTKLYGPPIFPGQQVLGLADIPFVCFIGFGGFFSSPIPLYGLRMSLVGTSPPKPPTPVSFI